MRRRNIPANRKFSTRPTMMRRRDSLYSKSCTTRARVVRSLPSFVRTPILLVDFFRRIERDDFDRINATHVRFVSCRSTFSPRIFEHFFQCMRRRFCIEFSFCEWQRKQNETQSTRIRHMPFCFSALHRLFIDGFFFSLYEFNDYCFRLRSTLQRNYSNEWQKWAKISRAIWRNFTESDNFCFLLMASTRNAMNCNRSRTNEEKYNCTQLKCAHVYIVTKMCDLFTVR